MGTPNEHTPRKPRPSELKKRAEREAAAKKPAAKAPAPKVAGTLKKTDDIDKVRTYIAKAIALKFGTMTAYAEKEEVSLQYISNVMSGNKPIPAWMYKRFKINHVVNEHWEVTV
jgi:hypothetical protein